MFPLHPLFLGFLVALGVGLLIGIDRERKKGEGPARQAAGLRTFTLAALLGAVAIVTGGELLLAAVALGVVAFAGLSYWRARDSDPGLTTETALVLVTLLGGLAIREPAFAAGLGVVTAVLLAARSALHRFVLAVLTDQEIRSLLIFAGATLVVLPLLPDRAIGPYGALNLHTIWIVVILVMAVSALGYIAVRLLGARYGLPLAGLAAGFISSIATIGSMGARARKEPGAAAARRRRRRAVVDRHHRAARHPDRRHQHGDAEGLLSSAGLFRRGGVALRRRLHLVGAAAHGRGP